MIGADRRPLRFCTIFARVRRATSELWIISSSVNWSSGVYSCGPYPTVGAREPLDRVAQLAEHKYCHSQARPFRLRFAGVVAMLPICPPATL